MARWRTIACIAASCLLLAGCGTSSHAAPKAPPYAAQASHICASELSKLNSIVRPTTPEAAISYLPRAVAIMHAENAQLRALDPSSSAEGELSAALATSDRLSALLSDFLHHLKTGIVELTSFAQVQTQSNALRLQIDSHFRRAGLTACLQ